MYRLDGARAAAPITKHKRRGNGLFARILLDPRRLFAGVRVEGCVKVWVAGSDGRRAPLPPRHDLFDHSPAGFEWGYGGSGPAQLALAILANVTDDDQAVRYHQYFKRRVVSQFPKLFWSMRLEEVIKELDLCALDAGLDGLPPKCLEGEGGAK